VRTFTVTTRNTVK